MTLLQREEVTIEHATEAGKKQLDIRDILAQMDIRPENIQRIISPK